MLGFNHLGRLGYLANQMFQYAAIKGIASNNDMPYMIPHDSEMQLSNGFKMSTATEIRGFVGSTSKKDKKGAPVDCRIVTECGFHFDSELFHDPPHDASLYGFFQSEKYFLGIWNELQIDFTFRDEISQHCERVVDQIDGKTVSLHVRRKDYLKNVRQHFNLPDQWFQNACDLFPDHTVLVFSDDIDWCKNQMMFKNDRFLFSSSVDGKIKQPDGRWDSRNMDHWYDLCLQALCDDNIISNSTFSWWGAYLNKNPEKTVIAPDPQNKWFGPGNHHLDTGDLIPGGWTTI